VDADAHGWYIDPAMGGEVREAIMDAQHPVKRLTAADRLLATRPIADLLAVDWTQTDRVVGTILGVSSSDAWRLRHRLQEQGHRIPVGQGRPSPTTTPIPPKPATHPPWRCPACTFKSRAPEGLADHVSVAHLTTGDADEINGAWRCPAPECGSRAPLQTAMEFLAHLDQHMLGRVKVEPLPRIPAPSAPAREPKAPRKPPSPPEEPPAEDESGPTQPTAWRCPACPYLAATADGLAGHVRLVHVMLTAEDKAPASWACPMGGCGPERFGGAADLALHLEAHAILEPAVAPKRRGRPRDPVLPCSVSGCDAPVVGRGLCRRHYDKDRKRRRSEGQGGTA